MLLDARSGEVSLLRAEQVRFRCALSAVALVAAERPPRSVDVICASAREASTLGPRNDHNDRLREIAVDPVAKFFRVVLADGFAVFRGWLVVYGVVGAQMGWVLRPFVGTPDLPFEFFRERESNFLEGFLRSLALLFS